MEPELLLENADWARRLARRLVKDDHLADDLVQEAWLKAIEAGPSNPASLRAWLHRVLLNLSLRSARSNRRRTRRERRVAREEETPSTESTVDKLQAHRLLADTVGALREPYRSTLILTYYEGLSPREIARRESVAVTTVRSRIERGVAHLREALDRAHAGDRNRWLGGLVPLFVEKASSLPARSHITNGVIMGSLATVLLVFFLVPDPSEPANRGVVVDDRGQPIGGALVQAFRANTAFSGFDGPTVRTNAEGQFRFEDDLDDVSFRLRITAPGKRAASGWAFASRPGRVTLLPAHEVRVRVVDASTKTPLSGARVWCSQLERGRGVYDPPIDETTSDPRGAASLSLCPGPAKVFVALTGFAPAMVEVDVQKGGIDVRVALAAGGRLSGIVVDANRRPILGVRIHAQANVLNIGPFDQTTTTDADGVFLLDDVPTIQTSAGRIILRMEHDAYARTVRRVELPTRQSAASVTIALEPAHSFDGIVRWKDGSPAKGLVVCVLPLATVAPVPGFRWLPVHESPFNGSLWERTKTDAEGRFSIGHLARGELVVEVNRDSMLLVRRTERVGEGRRDPPVIELDESPTERGALSVSVRSAAGKPIAGARVSLVEGAMNRSATTDAHGHVTLDDLPRRPLTGFVSPLEGVARQFEVTAEHWKAGTAAVQLKPGGTVSGTVHRPDGSPAVIAVRLMKIYDIRPDPSRLLGAHTNLGPGYLFGSKCRVVTDPAGRFRFRDVGEGDYRLSVDQAFRIASEPKAVRSGMTDVRVVVRSDAP